MVLASVITTLVDVGVVFVVAVVSVAVVSVAGVLVMLLPPRRKVNVEEVGRNRGMYNNNRTSKYQKI